MAPETPVKSQLPVMGCVMAWIKGTGPPDLPDIFQALSINSEALDTVKQLNEALSFGNSPLGRVREEAIATVVAVANRCRFGALTHGGFFRQYTGDQQTAAAMLVNHHLAGLDPADRQMLDFAVQATLKPSTLTRDDIENLRRVGFDDQEILSIILVTCLVNFMNRLADSLGIDIPPSYQKAVEKWLTGPAGRQPWLMRPVSQRTRNRGEGPLPGSLGPNGWNASPDWHDQEDEGGNGSDDSPLDDSGSLDRDGAIGEELPGLHLDGAENGMNLGELEDLLAGKESLDLDAMKVGPLADAIAGGNLDGIPEDAQQENTAENDEPGRDLEAPDAGGQPQGGAKVTEYTITTTPLDAPESEEEPESEAALDDANEGEEDVVLVDPNNPVTRFVREICVVVDSEVTSARDLYIAYLRWCDENYEPPMPQRGFGMILTQLGFNRRRRGRGRNWSWWGVGLGTKNTSGEDEDPDSEYSDNLEDEE